MNVARRYKAPYRPSVAQEAGALPLDAGEVVRWEGRVWAGEGTPPKRTPEGYVVVTDRRIRLVTHRLLGADRVLDIPFEAVRGVARDQQRGFLVVRFVDEQGAVSSLHLGGFSFASAAAPAAGLPSRTDAAATAAIERAILDACGPDAGGSTSG